MKGGATCSLALMTASPLSAVLFDLDGTLIESGRVWDDAMVALAARRGAVVPAEVLALTQGLSSPAAMTLVHTYLAWLDRDVAADVAWIEARVRDIYLDQVRWRPGARALVRRIRAAGISTGLVTSTRRELVSLVLATIRPGAFDVVVSLDDVRNAKPDPEPYLTAAARLGVPVERCVVIEDSAPGTASAHAAGCRVLHVGGDPPDTHHLAVESLVDVDLGLLTSLVAGGERQLS
jgi:HAD superfamily hydrolase (TIGR01509 family)